MTNQHPEEQKEKSTSAKPDTVVMPTNKDYFAFLSHKKKNSKLGSATEGLALRVGDTLLHSINTILTTAIVGEGSLGSYLRKNFL